MVSNLDAVLVAVEGALVLLAPANTVARRTKAFDRLCRDAEFVGDGLLNSQRFKDTQAGNALNRFKVAGERGLGF